MMNIQLPHAIGVGLFALSLACPTPDAPEAPQAPQAPNFDCSSEVVLLPSLDFELHCDMNPPQILAARMDDDPSGTEDQRCHDSGGRVLYIPETDTFICIDMDY